MLFHHRIFICSCALLGLFRTQDIKAVDYGWSINNYSSNYVDFHAFFDGVEKAYITGRAPGTGWGYATANATIPQITIKVYTNSVFAQEMGPVTGVAWTYVPVPDYTGSGGPTNHYCYIHILWTNQWNKFAIAMPMITDGGGEHFPWGGDSWAVAPGGVVDTWLTNSLCGTLSFGDTRPDNPTPDFSGEMIPGDSYNPVPNTPPSAPNAGTNQNPVPYPPMQPYGQTNGATGQDIMTAAGAIINAIGQSELTTARGLSNVVGAVNGASSNIVGAINGSTNGLASIGTNINSIRTNLLALGTNISGLADRDLRRGTNAQWTAEQVLDKSTNYLQNASNLISGVAAQLSNLGYTNALVTAKGNLQTGLGGTVDPAFGMWNLGWTQINVKSWLAGDCAPVGQTSMAAFWLWVRAVLLWGALAMCVSIYIWEIKDGLVKVCTVPQIQVNNEMAGIFSEIPGVNFTARLMLVIAFMAMLVMLPSLGVALLSQAASGLGVVDVGTTLAASNVANVPSNVANVFGSCNTMLPILEWIIFGVNLVIGQWAIDLLVSWLLVFNKALGF